MSLISVRMHKTKAVIYSEFPEWILRTSEDEAKQMNEQDKPQKKEIQK